MTYSKEQYDKFKQIMWNSKLTHSERVKLIKQLKEENQQ